MDNQWVRSSFCADKSCVEIRRDGGGILIRQSDDPDGPRLRFTPDEWTAFVGGVKAGEFDR
jgi:hypothetical protein